MRPLINAYNSLSSAVRSRLDRAGGFALNDKRDYAKDYGWPDRLTFAQFYELYSRNGLARGGVDKTIGKTWETMPAFWEAEEPAESQIEKDIRRHFQKRNIWRGLMEADRRGMVGGYAAAILILADGKTLDQPVERLSSIEDVKAVVPAWEGQLMVTEWVMDPFDDNYGEPLLFQFDENEFSHGQQGVVRQVTVHRDRVLIFSDDGTTFAPSSLEAGYNDLIDADKIKGAGGEGFYKSARASIIIEAPNGIKPEDMRTMMGAGNNGELIDKVNGQVADFQDNIDKALMLGGFTAKTLNISLPDPEPYWTLAAQQFAASMGIPFKILVGNITGERASTEDAKEWSKTCMSRRANRVIPVLQNFIDRLVAWGALPEADWVVGWDDLTEATAAEKIERALKMAEINAKGEMAFIPDEIREAAGFAPAEEVEGYEEWLAEQEERQRQAAEDMAVDAIDEEDDPNV